jgi:hypothetical protein
MGARITNSGNDHSRFIIFGSIELAKFFRDLAGGAAHGRRPGGPSDELLAHS